MKNSILSLTLLMSHCICITGTQPKLGSLRSEILLQASNIAPLLQRLSTLKEENHRLDEFYAKKSSILSDNLVSQNITEVEYLTACEEFQTEWSKAKESRKYEITQIRAKLCEQIVPKIKEIVEKSNIIYILFTLPNNTVRLINVEQVDWNTLFDLSPGQQGKYHLDDLLKLLIESLDCIDISNSTVALLNKTKA